MIVGHNITEVIADKSCCQRMTNDDYKAMLISSFGEFVSECLPAPRLTLFSFEETVVPLDSD